MCEKCEALIKEAHMAYVVSRGKDKGNMDIFSAGLGMFYEKIVERATKNSADFMKRIDAGEAQIVSKADFSMAQLVGERATIEFMLDYTGQHLGNLESAAAIEIVKLRNALLATRHESNPDKVKEIVDQALSAESKFVEAAEKPKMH